MKLALFDFDGTLIDSQYVIISLLEALADEFNLTLPESRYEKLVGVGLPLPLALAEIFKDLSSEDIEKMVAFYRQNQVELLKNVQEMPLFPEAIQTLDTLQKEGWLLGVVTSKARKPLLEVLDRHQIDKYFVTLQTPDDGPGKPGPEPVLAAMAEVAGNPEQTYMIGDTEFDILAGARANVKTIGVTWGYHPKPRLEEAGADFIVDTFGEMQNIILSPDLKSNSMSPNKS